MSLFSYTGLLLSIACLVLAGIIFKFARNRSHMIWGCFNIIVALWGGGTFWASMANTPINAIIRWKITYIPCTFIAIVFYHLVCEFCGLHRSKMLKFVYIQGVIFLPFIIFSNLFVRETIYIFNSIYYHKATVLFVVWLSIWSVITVCAFVELKRFVNLTTGIKGNYALYLFWGMLLGFAGGTATVIPSFGIKVYPAWHFSICIYASIMTYAMLRYRFMDISLSITRTGIFVLLYFLLLGVPVSIASNLEPLLRAFLEDKWWWAPVGLLVVFALIGPFVYIYISRKAEDRLLREQRRYQHTLRQASEGMVRIKDLHKLLNLIVHIVTKTVKIDFAAVFLLESEEGRYVLSASRGKINVPSKYILNKDSSLVKHLHCFKQPLVSEEIKLQSQDSPKDWSLKEVVNDIAQVNAEIIVPSFVGEKLLGILMLGRRISNKMYSQEDLDVFSTLSNQAALAIENAQFYEEVKRTQEQLFQAEKMTTIGTMADGLSHQINNRFQALSLITSDSIDVLQNTDLNDLAKVKDSFEQLKYALERIKTNVLQGGEVVKGLLKYSRPGEKGFEAIEFNAIFDGALEMVQYKIKLSELEIEKDIPVLLSRIKGNVTQLQEVFFNLIDNAYDAIREKRGILKDLSFKGKISIAVSRENEYLRVIFKDNGMGVQDRDKRKLFAPFFTTKASSNKGTGLGLYVIQKIIHFHNGTIDMDSTHGVGTRFEITLPIYKI